MARRPRDSAMVELLLHVTGRTGNPTDLTRVGLGKRSLDRKVFMIVIVTEESPLIVAVVFNPDINTEMTLIGQYVECENPDCEHEFHWWVDAIAIPPEGRNSGTVSETWMPLSFPDTVEDALNEALEDARQDLIDKIDARHE